MEIGSKIGGRYRIAEELGRGSFGTTYAADDLQAGRRVAIKQLDLRRVDDWKTVELFEREARVLASLDHPQIPDYVEFVPVAEHHTGYLVQELAPGRSLEARLAAGERFTVSQVRELAEQLLGVLVYLADLSPPVVHRDIKPGNVILGDGLGEGARCYLVDFGSVRDAVEASSTGGSTVAGTFGYMAPEQLHGEASPRSDLFGLGMTLVHLLTGTCPAELERKRLEVDFRPHLQVGHELADFVERLIKPIPDDRFASPRAALDQLRGVSLKVGPVGVASVGLSGDLSGDAIAASVAHRASVAEAAARRDQASTQQRIEQVARRARPRVQLVEDPEGFTLTLKPTPLEFRFLVQLPVPLFMTANPGFVVAGGTPFLGPHWPVLATNPGARFVVWGLFLLSVSLLIAQLRGRDLHVRVAGKHFAAWRRDPRKPIAIGPLTHLQISVIQPGANGYGAVGLDLGEKTSETFVRLSSKDLELLTQAQQALRDS